MAAYALRRLLAAVPVVLGVLVGVFLILHLAPGDPARMVAGDQAPPELVEEIRAALGLDQPVLVQMARYFGRVLRGDLGRSIASNRSVAEQILPPLQNTYQLVMAATILALVIALPMGIVAAVNRGRIFDRVAVVVAVAGNSFPSFWVGLMMMWWLGYRLSLLPLSGWKSNPWTVEFWRYALMPVVTLATVQLASVARITRSSMLEVLGLDYIRTARAKGLGERVVLYRHALRNAALPVITVVAVQFGYFLGGAVVTESVFAIPGLGRLLVDAISLRDFPLVQGGVLVFSVGFVLLNLVADLAYGLMDPRIRYD